MNSISINLTSKSRLDGPWLNIEQVNEAGNAQYANLTDAMEMVSYSQSGLTATEYNTNCDMSIDDQTIAIPMEVYVWPSSLDLHYSLAGKDRDDNPVALIISPKRQVGIDLEDTIIVELSDFYAFDSLVDVHSMIFETPCFNRLGERVDYPEMEFVGNEIRFNAEIFASIRVSYTAIGYQHTVTLTTENSQAAIDALKSQIIEQSATADTAVKMSIAGVTVVASFAGLEEEAATLRVPESVLNCLSQCDDGELVTTPKYSESTGPGEEDVDYVLKKKVWYSTCTGSVITTRVERVPA